MRSVSWTLCFPLFSQNFPIGWHLSFLHPEWWVYSYLHCHVLSQLVQHQGPLLRGRRGTNTDWPCPPLKPVASNEEDSYSPSEFWLLQSPIAVFCGCHDWLPWAEVKSEGWGKWNVFALSLFRVSFSDPWAKLEGFSGNSFWLLPIPTASVLASDQGIPEGKAMANSPLGWWYF